MILEPTEEHEELRRSVRRFLGDKAPSAEVRRVMGTPEGYDPTVWMQMAGQLGLQGLGVPEEYGGAGFGFPEWAVALEEMGRAVVPAPFLSTVLAATAIRGAGDEDACKDLLPALASGESVGTIAICGDEGRWGAPETVAATASDGGWQLQGHASFVTYGHVADVVVTTASAGERLGLFAVDANAAGLSRTPLRTLDETRPMARLAFDGVSARLLGELGADDAVAYVLDVAATLLAAEQVGVASSCQEMAIEYAKIRVQFGRPIGSFQAVKHKCADMLAATELARSTAYHAVWAAAQSPGDLPAAASMAKAACSEACFQAAADNVHVHGGVGFTWEHDAHLYYRRAKASELLFGSSSRHRELLAQRADWQRDLEVQEEVSAPADESPDVAAFRQRARDWLTARADAPETQPATEEGRFGDIAASQRFQAGLHDAGFAGITWPVEYGGQGLTPPYERACNEEAAAFELPTGIFSIGLGMCGPALLTFGTEAQKQAHLRPMLRGEKIWCQLFSEPGAGSDVAGLQTSAVRDGDHWLVSGQKVWTTGAQVADFGIVIARTDSTVPKHAGITMFVVDMHAPGVTVRPLHQMTGGGEFTEVFLDQVRIPADSVVGEVNEGWHAATVMLMNERVAIGAGRRSHRDATSAHSLAELAGERGLHDAPVVWQRLADLLVRQRSLELLSVRIRNRVRAGVDPGPFASIAKLAGAQLTKTAANLAVEVAGPGAVAWDPDDPDGGTWAGAILAAPSAAIAGGTDEIQRNIIGDRVLGLPREPRVDRDVPFRELNVGTQRSS